MWILVAYRHGLRAFELCDLKWSQVEFDRAATLHVRRVKNGMPAVHPIRGDELRALRELQRHTSSGYVFETERGCPFTTDAVNRLVKRIGFPFKVTSTCCGTAAATRWPMRHMTRGQFRTGSVIGRSSTPPAIPNQAKNGLGTFGALD
jgi:integrase